MGGASSAAAPEPVVPDPSAGGYSCLLTTSASSLKAAPTSHLKLFVRPWSEVVPLPAFQVGDLIIGAITARDGDKHHPFRARFSDRDARGGAYSFVYDGMYEAGTFRLEGQKILLLGGANSFRGEGARGELRLRDSPDASDLWVDGSVSVIVPQRRAVRPRAVQQVDVLTVEAKLIQQGLDMQPGGGLARALLYEHALLWCSVTAAGLVSIWHSSCEDGAAPGVYVGYLPLLAWHVYQEHSLYKRYMARWASWSTMKMVLQYFYSITDHYDVLTDTIFVVVAMKCSEEITPHWVSQWKAVPYMGDACAEWAGYIGFGPFNVIIYIGLVLMPQCLAGLCSLCQMQRNTLSWDVAGELVEEDILRLQDAAANASFYAVEIGVKEYVEEYIEKYNTHQQDVGSQERSQIHDETLHVRVFKRVFLENLLQMWNQTTLLGVRFKIQSSWATAQVLVSVVIGLGVALSRACALGISIRDVVFLPITICRALQFEFANLVFWDTTGQIVREWRSGCLEVVPASKAHVSKENSVSIHTYNEETFRAALRRQRQVLMGVIILIFCAVLLVRTCGIYHCDGPFNLTSGCVDALLSANDGPAEPVGPGGHPAGDKHGSLWRGGDR